LKSGKDIRRYLARLIGRLERGEIDPSLAGRIGYIANVLIRCVEVEVIEERLSEIERKIGGGL
jgi:hypothetical protein